MRVGPAGCSPAKMAPAGQDLPGAAGRALAAYIPGKPLSKNARRGTLLVPVFLSLVWGACLLPDGLGQTPVLGAGSVTGGPGNAITIPVVFTPGATPVGALQFDLAYSSTATYASTSAGPAAGAAAKSAVGSNVRGGLRVIVFGVNQNPIPSGIVARVKLKIAAGAGPGSMSVLIGGIVASDASARSVGVSGKNGSITIVVPADTTPPIISGVTISNIASSEATVTWVTNEPADSQVDFVDAEGQSLSSPRDATLQTAHSVTLTDLQPDTLYHYRVTSRDARGNLSTSADFAFTTKSDLDEPTTLALPRILTETADDAPYVESYTGIALVNLDIQPANLTFTAIDTSGNAIAGPDISNPVSRVLNPDGQIPLNDGQLFGKGIATSRSTGWIKLESTTTKVRGFFLIYNNVLTLLDGANASSGTVSSAIFPEIEVNGSTKLDIVNASPSPTSVIVDLVRPDGKLRGSVTRTVSGNGAVVGDLYADLFAGVAPSATDYVRVTSSRGVQAFASLRRGSGDNEAFSGLDGSAGATTLYSPQYAVGGPWRSALSVVNLDTLDGVVTFRLIGDDAVQIGPSISLPIAPRGKISIDDPDFFQVSDPGKVTQGYVEVVSSGVKLTGSVLFGDRQRRTFACALPLVSKLQSSLLLGHVASDDLYYTGIALLNPDTTRDAIARLDLIGADGRLVASTTEIVPARHRQSRLLAEYFPSVSGENRTSGYVRVRVDTPIAAFSLFGTNDLSVLSAIPPQDVP